jgi:hypothetical protein
MAKDECPAPTVDIDVPASPRSMLRKRFGLFLTVVGFVILLGLIKTGIHALRFEFLNLNALFTSVIAGAVFIIGFLLSAILTDYKEAERLPAELRSSLEAIHDDCVSFARRNKDYDPRAVRAQLLHIVECLPSKLNARGDQNLAGVIKHVDALTDEFCILEELDMPPNYIVRLRAEQGIVRRALFRMYHMQRIQFVPSVHVLVQSLVVAVVSLLLFLKTEGSPESALIFGAISYMFVYVLYLAATLEQPFRKGRHSLDDVSLFLLREFESKLRRATEPL